MHGGRRIVGVISGLCSGRNGRTSPLTCLDLRALLSLSLTAGHFNRLFFVLPDGYPLNYSDPLLFAKVAYC